MLHAKIKNMPLPFTNVDLHYAIYLAVSAYDGENDRNGIPYIYHLFYVSACQPTIDGKILGMLHDIVEDDYLSIEYIRESFGELMAEYVIAITHDKNEDYESYIHRVCEYEVTARTKLSDIAHNSLPSRMDDKAAKKMPKYVAAYKTICAAWHFPIESLIDNEDNIRKHEELSAI